MQTRQVKFYLSDDLHKALGHAAVEQSITRSEIAEAVLRQHFGLPQLVRTPKPPTALAS